MFIGIVIVAVLYFNQPTPSPISTSSTYVSLQETDFQMTNSTGCLLQRTTGPFNGLVVEHWIITVRNRFSENVQFVNASILVTTLAFADKSTTGLYSYLPVAGPNDTAVLTFPIDFPISGAYFERSYTHVDYAPFTVTICVMQYGHVQRFRLSPELTALPSSAPNC